MFSTSSAVTPISTSPVGILGLFVPAGRCADLAGDADDAFAAQRGRALEQFLRQIRRVENRLRAAFAVADVNKDQAAQVAAGMDPAGQGDRLPDVRRAQFVAMMRAFHVKMLWEGWRVADPNSGTAPRRPSGKANTDSGQESGGFQRNYSRFQRAGRISVLSSSLAIQSQRDCALQPKVAPIFRGDLGSRSGNGNNANGVVAEVTGPRARNGRNRVAVGNGWGR